MKLALRVHKACFALPAGAHFESVTLTDGALRELFHKLGACRRDGGL